MRKSIVIVAFAVLTTTGCDLPGRPSPNSAVLPPAKILDFNALVRTNCVGCHGLDGKGGAAIAINDPVLLAGLDDATIRGIVTNGFPGTVMPAFAQSAGGILTSAQVDAIVAGIRTNWAKPNVLQGRNPGHDTDQQAGDPERGAKVYSAGCASCHGQEGRGGPRAGSIVDSAYLSLVSDQFLRTIVMVGCREPGDARPRPMSGQDRSDVVAWLAAKRPRSTKGSSSGEAAVEGVQ
jgi:cytochrome c oxidase cbb3-type subunit III